MSGFELPRITKNLLIINLVVWVFCYLFKVIGCEYENILIDIFGLHSTIQSNFFFHQLITYMFVHKAFSHLFFNMFALCMFGGAIERVWGEKRFLIYYMTTGIGAGLVQLLVSDFLCKYISNTDIYMCSVTIGASGAIFGLLLAFGILFPEVPLYIMFIPIPIKAKYFVAGYGIIEFFCGISNYADISVGEVKDNVAHFAHLGGMLFGLFLIFYWRNKINIFKN